MLKDCSLSIRMLVGASHQDKPDAAVLHEGGPGPQSLLLRAKQTIYSRPRLNPGSSIWRHLPFSIPPVPAGPISTACCRRYRDTGHSNRQCTGQPQGNKLRESHAYSLFANDLGAITNHAVGNEQGHVDSMMPLIPHWMIAYLSTEKHGVSKPSTGPSAKCYSLGLSGASPPSGLYLPQ